ncbi:hypothetical protein ATANTOWER_015865 [Ataeniobius toweri]|uniref:Pentraxin (PTX) domain-containing protein n=1 Tax=Ataeniobius toweri TaxID=208326 RepID=A0ABU7BHJ1_9TELE|nr:hypothetical protein [Ataeniobius toweri]
MLKRCVNHDSPTTSRDLRYYPRSLATVVLFNHLGDFSLVLPPPEVPDGLPESIRGQPVVLLHGLTKLLPGPRFCLCHSLGCGTLGLTVPLSCLRSPTSQPQPIGLLLQLDSIPYCQCPPPGSGIAAVTGNPRPNGHSYGRQHRASTIDDGGFASLYDADNLCCKSPRFFTDLLGLDNKLNVWHSVCLTWDSESGIGQLWFDGTSSVRKFLSGSEISQPLVILGQEQDSYGGGFDSQQSFVGMMSDIHLWDYVLSPCEIQRYVDNLNFTPGNVLNWMALTCDITEGVLIEDKQKTCY